MFEQRVTACFYVRDRRRKEDSPYVGVVGYRFKDRAKIVPFQH